MKKMLVLIAVMLMAMPMVASADLVGDCYDCHTMHNSEQNSRVVDSGDEEGLPNLLKFTCLGCHAVNPTGGGESYQLPGGSWVPQVAHGGATDKAGGNFNQTTSRKVHSVVDVTAAGIAPVVVTGENYWDQPPGIPHTENRNVFTSETATNAFDMFTCAGARGCHGTRSQVLFADTVTNSTGGNNIEAIRRRTGMAAISGAHHNNVDGVAINSDGYTTNWSHDGEIVAAGYRFIPGLKGFENVARKYVSGTDHNEYYGVQAGIGSGCGACHQQGTGGAGSRAALNSGIKVPNNSHSGFCSSCHGYFHSSGSIENWAAEEEVGVGETIGDYVYNGVSGAFLRHPSDYVIPNRGEYSAYTTYDPTAPVARNYVANSAVATVTPGSDMVGCLSCHVAHGSANDYLLRFDYTTMTAGNYANQAAAQAAGGCLACHTLKGVLPANRP